jgi:hypothetical protein
MPVSNERFVRAFGSPKRAAYQDTDEPHFVATNSFFASAGGR